MQVFPASEHSVFTMPHERSPFIALAPGLVRDDLLMVPPEIPERVLTFIRERIDSVPELEALLLLSAHPAKSWTAADVASRVYVSGSRAAEILAVLQRRGLVTHAASGPDQYTFRPADETAAQLIAEVERAYRSNLIAVATFIHENAPASVREFARAFDLKKER